MLVSYFYEELDYQVQISGSSEYFSIFEELDSMSSKELPDWLKGLHALLKFFERRSNAGYVFDRALRGYSRDKKE